jgi:hypothetical protein
MRFVGFRLAAGPCNDRTDDTGLGPVILRHPRVDGPLCGQLPDRGASPHRESASLLSTSDRQT